VRDGVSGVLVDGHSTEAWAAALGDALRGRARLAAGAVLHAGSFSWDRTADGLLAAYRDGLTVPTQVATG
jgi:D-inositol-3-phosphate glycosyltransferase